ncbi:MAG TPA: glycosyltransferase [Clostridium sp.]|uniref:glycosyltransferase n=1 Tax=Clostridium sp. TaxID=1506 RepID=UPI002F91DE50
MSKISRVIYNIERKVINLIIEENQTNKKIIIHCRGLFGSFIGLKVRRKLKNNFNIKMISDFRGSVIDEYLMRYKHKNSLYKIMLKILILKINSIQSNVCKNADYILFVSKKLEEYLKSKYIINCGVSIIPTCIDANKSRFDQEQRRKIRNEMKLEDKFVVAYCGGGQSYQSPEDLINAFIMINQRVEEAFFLILTGDKETFATFLNVSNVDKAKYLIRYAPHNEVYKYLSAADCGILLRDSNNVNKVASPTKFAEYINCNLPVFISHNIGDIDEISAKYNLCIYEEDIDNIKIKIDEIKKNDGNFKILIGDYYEWKRNIKTIMSIYNKF